MEILHIPSEQDFRRWIKAALIEYFENAPLKIASASPDEEDFLNRKQVAGIFGISLVTLHAWINNGLPSHKQGGRVYFLRSEVFEYVKENKGPSIESKDRARCLRMKKLDKTG